MNKIQKSIVSLVSPHILCVVLIFFGMSLRLKNYMENRSFWLDEAWVALDVSTRTLKEMFLGVLPQAKIFHILQ
jgi:hypothetical protein